MKRIIALVLALVASTAVGASVQIPMRNASGGGYDIHGVADASSACTGCVGEYLTNFASQSSPVSGTAYSSSAITVTPGTWLIWVQCSIGGYSTAPTVSLLRCGASTAGSTGFQLGVNNQISLASGLQLNSAQGWDTSAGPWLYKTAASIVVNGTILMTQTGGAGASFNDSTTVNAVRVR